MARPAVTVDTFWERVSVGEPDECWLWLRHIRDCGYGEVWWRGQSAKSHRVAYELHHDITLSKSPIRHKNETIVMHTCDNRACCNPAHLRLGTHRANYDDCVSKGRERHPVGEQHGRAKLTWEQVRHIRKRFAMGERQHALAREYGLDPSSIADIRFGITWKEQGV